MKLLLPICLAGFAVMTSGCATSKRSATRPADTTVEASFSRQLASPSAYPVQPTYVPAEQAAPEGSMPVMRERQVKKVYLRGYQDEAGNAYGPSVKYVVTDDGGWDMDAINNPTKAYIPQSMVNAPQSFTAAQPVSANTPRPAAEGPSIKDLYPVDQVTVTGYTERNQEAYARETAAKMGPEFITIWDEDLGWIIVPKAALSVRS